MLLVILGIAVAIATVTIVAGVFISLMDHTEAIWNIEEHDFDQPPPEVKFTSFDSQKCKD